MITIATLNPCIDWQYSVPAFCYGGMNRVRHTYQSAASKGTNVAIVLKNLGQAPHCIGFNFAEGGDKVAAKFDAFNITHDFETIAGAVRINIKLYEESTGVMTELNQPGAFVPEIHVKNFETKIAQFAQKSGENGILVLSGSLPAGVPADIYAKLTDLWPGKVFLDAEGDTLRLALQGQTLPYAIKPNLFELESTFGVRLTSPMEIADFCRENITVKGVKLVCVSMGADGAVLITPSTAYFCPPPDIAVCGVQGAGDSMVAGLIHGVLTHATDADLLRYGVAAASASVIREGTDLCTREDFYAMLNIVPPLSTISIDLGGPPCQTKPCHAYYW